MITSLSNLSPKVLAVKLSADGERSVRKRHPWIFTSSIVKINKEGITGDIAVIFSKKENKAIGVGLYDTSSPIAIKMLHFGGAAQLDASFFSNSIEKAYAIRTPLLNTHTNAYRLLFGENDGFPGLIADVYDSILVVKVYSAIWAPYLNTILIELQRVSQAQVIIIRLSRLLQKEGFHGVKDGDIIQGNLDNETIVFNEHGIRFSANVIKGHKTGYFLDHRHNRKQVGKLSKSKTVLDVFAYAGGFSVHALAQGAKEVTSIDISKQALDLALANGKLNAYSGIHNIIAGDAFKILRKLIKEKHRYDIVVIDPPSFAKSQKEIPIALKKYQELARLGVQLVKSEGTLVLASCSSRIVAEDFFETHEQVFQQLKIPYEVMDTTYHDVDHPIGFPEGAYLKTRYYQVFS